MSIHTSYDTIDHDVEVLGDFNHVVGSINNSSVVVRDRNNSVDIRDNNGSIVVRCSHSNIIVHKNMGNIDVDGDHNIISVIHPLYLGIVRLRGGSNNTLNGLPLVGDVIDGNDRQMRREPNNDRSSNRLNPSYLSSMNIENNIEVV